MKTITYVMRKELYRIFSDKKMIFSLFVLPAILVIGIYGLMGFLIKSMIADQEDHIATVVIYNAPQELKDMMQEEDQREQYKVTYKDTLEKEELSEDKNAVYHGKLDLIVYLPTDFIEQVKNYQEGDAIPDIQTYYNPSEDYSSNAHEEYKTLLDSYRAELLKTRMKGLDKLTVFTVDADNQESIIQNEDKAQGKLLGAIIPYVITILLFAGAMSLGIDTITGEKERGTLASMLIMPIKRSAIVYGKLLALMILTGLSALIYGLSMILTLPIMAGVYPASGDSVSGDAINIHFQASQAIMLLVLIVTLVFLYVALISLTAVLAKTVKEASSYVMPAYMIVMVCGMISMFTGDKITTMQYAIPLYGATIALKNVFTYDITTTGFIIAVVSNLITGGVLAYIVAKAFDNEKIMFNA